MLPDNAQIHLRQLSNVGILCILPGLVLNRHVRNVLITSKSSSQSWFLLIRELCIYTYEAAFCEYVYLCVLEKSQQNLYRT